MPSRQVRELEAKHQVIRRLAEKGKRGRTRFISAEGCYSHRAASQPGIRIKMAHKQFVGLTVPSDEQIYAVNGAVWQCPKAASVSVGELERHSQQPASLCASHSARQAAEEPGRPR